MNSVFLVVLAAMILIVVLLRMKMPIGISIVCGGLLIWAFESLELIALWDAFVQTLQQWRTWELIFCLYFVMCLEIELRKSNTLKGIVKTMRDVFSSNKVTLAVMPAFLGLLPSVGGARFSSPIVREASAGIDVDADEQSAINIWFRHIFEFSNPLVPGMILACVISGIPVGSLILHMGWLTVISFVLGWIILVRPLKIVNKDLATNTSGERHIDWKSVFLGLGPVFMVMFLVIICNLSAAIATGAVIVSFIPLFYLLGRPVPIKDIFIESLDKRLFFNVFLILYFIQILTVTGTLQEIVDGVQAADLSQPVLFAVLSFIFGLITGMSQGYIAMVMPLVALMSPGNVVLAGIVMAFGVAGQMITPTHVCILVTVDYFKSDLWRTILKCGLVSLAMVAVFTAWTYLRYYSGIL